MLIRLFSPGTEPPTVCPFVARSRNELRLEKKKVDFSHRIRLCAAQLVARVRTSVPRRPRKYYRYFRRIIKILKKPKMFTNSVKQSYRERLKSKSYISILPIVTDGEKKNLNVQRIAMKWMFCFNISCAGIWSATWIFKIYTVTAGNIKRFQVGALMIDKIETIGHCSEITDDQNFSMFLRSIWTT